jgi:hypothetical protein
MKTKNLIAALLFAASSAFAQVPQGIPYQAVARNGQGQPLANTIVIVRFSILDSTATGTAVYVESHSITTSSLGLFTANVGMGTVSTGTFSAINWGQNYKFLKVELDTTATGTSYIDLGTQQMMSVPYALYASKASYIFENSPNSPGTIYSLHGNLVATSDTMIMFNKATLVHVKIAGGKGGHGGNTKNISHTGSIVTWPGGGGGLGGCTSFLIMIHPTDTIYLKLGQNGVNGCNSCYFYTWCQERGTDGSNGTESIFSINSSNHSNFLIKTTGGEGGKSPNCGYTSWAGCECTAGGVAGANGSIINGINSDSQGILLQTNSLNSAQIVLQW